MSCRLKIQHSIHWIQRVKFISGVFMKILKTRKVIDICTWNFYSTLVLPYWTKFHHFDESINGENTLRVSLVLFFDKYQLDPGDESKNEGQSAMLVWILFFVAYQLGSRDEYHSTDLSQPYLLSLLNNVLLLNLHGLLKSSRRIFFNRNLNDKNSFILYFQRYF